MSSADTADRSPATHAERLSNAPFVRFIGTPDGDALAAIGVLARTLDQPFQARLDRLATVSDDFDDVTVTVGTSGGDIALTDRPIASTALSIANELSNASLAPAITTLGLAGVSASERAVEPTVERLETAFERRPGVGVPTNGPIDGLAHSTLIHAPFSGDTEAVTELLGSIDDGRDDATRTSIASLVSMAVVKTPETRASHRIERLLHPLVAPAGPFATIAGYGDVLDGLARVAPGDGLALALGRSDPPEALECWRAYATTVHGAIDDCALERHPGCVVARLPDGSNAVLEPVARLIREFQSPEPVVLAVSGDSIVVTGTEDTAPALERALESTTPATPLTTTNGYTRVGVTDTDPVVTAFTEAI